MFARRLILCARPEALSLVLECERRIQALTAQHVPCHGMVWQHVDNPQWVESWLLFNDEHSFLAARSRMDTDLDLLAVIAAQQAGLEEDQPIVDSAEMRLAGAFGHGIGL